MNLVCLMKKRPVRELKRRLFSRVLFDRNRDPAQSVIIASTGRSGSTWLAELINADNVFRMMFEPFHTRVVHEKGLSQDVGYMSLEDLHDEHGRFIHEVLSGELRSPWSDVQNRKLFCSRRLIKDVSSNLMLSWLRHTYPRTPIVFLLRHPLAVAHSRKKMGWSADLTRYLKQPSLMQKHLEPFRSVMEAAEDPFLRHMLVWCIENYVPLAELDSTQLFPVFYEELLAEPSRLLPALCDYLRVPFSARMLKIVNRPSITSRKESAVVSGDASRHKWETELSEEEKARGMDLVKQFGLDRLYSMNPEPLVSSEAMFEGCGQEER